MRFTSPVGERAVAKPTSVAALYSRQRVGRDRNAEHQIFVVADTPL